LIFEVAIARLCPAMATSLQQLDHAAAILIRIRDLSYRAYGLRHAFRFCILFWSIAQKDKQQDGAAIADKRFFAAVNT